MRVEDLQRRLLSSNYFKDDCSAEEHSILYGEICSLREPVDPEYEAALDEIERIKSKRRQKNDTHICSKRNNPCT